MRSRDVSLNSIIYRTADDSLFLDQANYPPSASPIAHRLYTRLPSRVLVSYCGLFRRPSARRIIIPRMRNSHFRWLQVAWWGWSLRIRRLWATHQPKNRPWLDLESTYTMDPSCARHLGCDPHHRLVVLAVYFVVVRKEKNVDASVGG